MPRFSAWAIRAALLYWLAGFSLGGLMLANKGQPFWPQIWAVLPAHIEFLVLGWMVQLAMGVAFWILPRYPVPRSATTRAAGGERGRESVAGAAFILLNVGIVLVALQGLAEWGLALGRLLELSAGVLFLAHAWGRIRPLYPGG